MISFAQHNEDQILINLFLKKKIKSGVFVEFGAWVAWVEWECNRSHSFKNSKRAVFTALFFTYNLKF